MADDKKGVNVSDGSTDDVGHAIEVKVDNMMELKHAKDLKEGGDATTPAADAKPAATDEIGRLAAEWNAKGITEAKPIDTVEVKPVGSVEDKQVEDAVADITRQEADAALADLDDDAKPVEPESRNFWGKIKHFFRAWWHNRRARWGTIIGLVVLLLVLAILPPSRSFALNLVGARASASLTVLDATTELPLNNVTVTLGSVSAKTNAKGQVTLQNVKLGSQQLIVQKVAFATTKKSVSTGFGNNKLGQIALKAIGAQYSFKVTDYLSGKPIVGAQAASGQATALADKQGRIILTAADAGGDTLSVSVTADGYRTATVKVQVGTSQTTSVQLVTSLQTAYISKQTGKYDVYKADIDGANKKLLLAATGNETATNVLVPNSNGQVVALVNNRDDEHDSSGYLLQTLTLIDFDSGAPTVIDHSERLQIVDWQGDRIVYVAIKAGASAANPSRYLLMSYDYKTNQRLQLDHANAFNDVVSADGAIYYATSNGYNGGVSQFIKINADGSGKQVLLISEVWNVFRLDYADFRLATGDTNYTYKLGDTKPTTVTDAYNNQNRLYIDSPDGKHSLYVDDRDGKGALIAFDTTSQKETVLVETTGLSYPVRWLGNDTIVYRIETSKETADYAISLSGGSAKKVTDVTNAPGVALWYFY